MRLSRAIAASTAANPFVQIVRLAGCFVFLLGAFVLPTQARTIGPITFEDRTLTPAGTPAHGLIIATDHGQPIPPIRFRFLIEGEPSPSAAIRRGPDGNPAVEGWGIEGPTEGELRIDFGQSILGFSAGIGLLAKENEEAAVLVRSFDEQGELIAERIFPSFGTTDGSFSSVRIAVSSDGAIIRSASILWLSEARRYLFDNLTLNNLPVQPAPPPNGRLLSANAASPTMARLASGNLATGWLLNGRLQVAIVDSEDTLIQGPRFASFGDNLETGPSLLALSEGGFAVAWYSSAQSAGILPQGFYVRFFNEDNRATEPPLLIALMDSIDPRTARTSLSETRNGISLSWSDDRNAGVSLFSNGASTALEIGASTLQVECGIGSTLIEGMTMAIWCEAIEPEASSSNPNGPTTRLMAQTFSPNGAPIGTAFVVSERLLGGASDLHLEAMPSLSNRPSVVVVTWRQVKPQGRPVIFARLVSRIRTLSPVLRVQESANVLTHAPSLNVAEHGFLVTWRQSSNLSTDQLKARLFHRSGASASSEFELLSGDPIDLGGVAVQWTDEEIQLVWENTHEAPSTPGIFLSHFPIATSTTPCTTAGTTLCLGTTQRFRATVQWHDFEGNTGDGVAASITEDTGYFWFFKDGAADLVVKVIDGTASNSHHWLFFGSLTNAEFDLIVEDLLTGWVKTYHNPTQQFASVGDTAAFAELSLPSQDGTTSEFPTHQQTAFDPGWSTTALLELADSTFTSSESQTTDLAATVSDVETAGSCSQLAESQPGSVCLADRFLLSCQWEDFTGGFGPGHGRILAEDTGAFWFFEQANLELIIKIVDGRSLNEHFWVFYGALTNVGFSLSITDTVTGQETTYLNPTGVFASVGDLTSLSG